MSYKIVTPIIPKMVLTSCGKPRRGSGSRSSFTGVAVLKRNTRKHTRTRVDVTYPVLSREGFSLIDFLRVPVIMRLHYVMTKILGYNRF